MRKSQQVPSAHPTIVGLLLRVCLLLIIATTFSLGTIRVFAQIPEAQVAYQQESNLISNLQRIGATRIYSEYWTCNRLTFHSREQIICAVLDDSLKQGFNRYAPYYTIVQNARHPVYVFPQGSPQVRLIAQRVSSLHIPYHRYVFDGYVVYATATPLNA